MPLYCFLAVLFMCENMMFSCDCVIWSKLVPLGQISRSNVCFFSTRGFWHDFIASQKNRCVSLVPAVLHSIEWIFANSPPLSVRISGNSCSKGVWAAANFSRRCPNSYETASADLESCKMPTMKLQMVKSSVRMTFPPWRPITISISTQLVISWVSMYWRKSAYVRPFLKAGGT